MTLIKVDPSLLQSSAQDIQGNGQSIVSTGNQLWSAVEVAPSYDFQFFPKVATIGSEAQSRASQLGGNLTHLGERLQAKAFEFEATDNAALDGLGSIGGPIETTLINTYINVDDFAQDYLDLGHLITYTSYIETVSEKVLGTAPVLGTILTVEGAVVDDSEEFSNRPDRFLGATLVDSVVNIAAPLAIEGAGIALLVGVGLLAAPTAPVLLVGALASSLIWDVGLSPMYQKSEIRYNLIDRETAVVDDLAAHPNHAIGPLSAVSEAADFIGGPVKAAVDHFLP